MHLTPLKIKIQTRHARLTNGQEGFFLRKNPVRRSARWVRQFWICSNYSFDYTRGRWLLLSASALPGDHSTRHHRKRYNGFDQLLCPGLQGA
jgi:hypothetical protein